MFSHAFHVYIVCKNTLLCGGNKEYLSIYLNGMGSINIPTEDLSRHTVRIDADIFDISQVLTIILSASTSYLELMKKCRKINISYN